MKQEDVPWIQLVWNTHYASGQIPHATIEKGSFFLKDIVKLCDHFRGIALATVGPGDTVLLWTDVWNGHYLMNELPRLFSFSRNNKVSLAQFGGNPNIHANFHTPISQQANLELQQLHMIIEHIQTNTQDKDVWSYIWGTNKYASKKYYSTSNQ
jgi:hypothetical protein